MNAILLFAVLSPFTIAAANEVQALEGDPRLYEMLRAAQKTNLARLNKGRFRAKVIADWQRGMHAEAKALVIFSGEKTYREYTHATSQPDPQGKQRKTQSGKQTVKMIEEPGLLTMYVPKVKLLQKLEDSKKTYPEELKLRPDQIWFSLEGSRNWIEFLEPDTFAAEKFRRVLRRESENIVVLEHTNRKTGGRIRIVFSLAQGGNVVSYERVPGDPSRAFSGAGSFEWKRHPSDVWYLHKLSYHYETPAANPKYTKKYSLEVTEFDPDLKIAPEQFSLSALQVPNGTFVEEWNSTGRNKTYYKGGKKPRKNIGAILEELAKKLRSKGFAEKNRN
jgi:hypothetical protein